MELNQEIASFLDLVLDQASKSGDGLVELDKEKLGSEELIAAASKVLEKKNYGQWLGEGNFIVYPAGLEFIRSSSFTLLLKSKPKALKSEFKKRMERMEQVKVVYSPIKPWLVIWCVVSTVINLLLLYIHYT